MREGDQGIREEVDALIERLKLENEQARKS